MPIEPNTEIHLLANVPLGNDYEHQMTFPSLTEQESYFLGKSAYTFTNFTYQRDEVAIKVGRHRDDLYTCNYVMYKNNNFSTKWFYGFITDIEYVNPNTSRVFFELDVWQTWQFNCNFLPSFVEREHTNRWESDGTTPIVNRVDEGLEYGDMYQTVSVENIRPNNGYKWFVMVTKEALHTGTREVTPSIMGGAPQPLTYYVTPFKDGNTVPTVKLEDGTSVPVSPPDYALSELYKSQDATNNVVSLYITDYIGIPVTVTEGTPDTLTFPDSGGLNVGQAIIGGLYTLVVNQAPNFGFQEETVGTSKYDGFKSVNESKLLMSPYTLTVLDDFKGNRVEIKNDYIQSDDLTLILKGSLGTSNKTSWGVKHYAYDAGAGAGYSHEISNEHAVINNNPSDVAIVTDLLAAYLQGNRNSLEAQRNQIMYNAYMGGGSAVMGAAGGAMVAGPLGALAGGAVGVGQQIGSAYHQIQALQAKKKDIANTPPQITKMGGNTAYDTGNKYGGLYVIKKQITDDAIDRLENYFKMYGYKVNTLKDIDFKTRQHFNFIQTVGVGVTGNIPHEDIGKIKDMFDSGVTLWHGDFVGDYSLPNGEV